MPSCDWVRNCADGLKDPVGDVVGQLSGGEERCRRRRGGGGVMERLHVSRHAAVESGEVWELLLRRESGCRVLREGGRGEVWGRVWRAVTWWAEQRGAVAVSVAAHCVG